MGTRTVKTSPPAPPAGKTIAQIVSEVAARKKLLLVTELPRGLAAILIREGGNGPTTTMIVESAGLRELAQQILSGLGDDVHTLSATAVD